MVKKLKFSVIIIVLVSSFISETYASSERDKRKMRSIKETPAFLALPQTSSLPSVRPGDDGYYRKGVPLPAPRFMDNGNGTVTDNLTGLIWLGDLNEYSGGQAQQWEEAVDGCRYFSYAGYDDWRLPNIRELHSLVDYGYHAPPISQPNPFRNLQSERYWSGTPHAVRKDGFWNILFHSGGLHNSDKTEEYYVWPVRGGE